MRVIQMLPTLVFGDAIGNDTLALYEVLKKGGYKTAIYAEYFDERYKDIAALDKDYIPQKGDILIYHMSTGSDLNYRISDYPVKMVMIYHNITPGHFFAQYDAFVTEVCNSGRRATEYYKKKMSFCMADSEFNKQELLEMGYKCPVEVLPILIDFDDYKKKPNEKVIEKYNDGYINILFTGRVAPNKKHEDLIAAFCYYKKYINPKSRLLLVGRHDFFPGYYARLAEYVDYLGVEDVIFTGQVKFPDILAYYRVADVFLCLSEHEGFCVPLVESMMFDLPIIAYDSCAVGETLGGSGFLLPDKSPAVAAEAIQRVVTDKVLQRTMIEGQRKRLEHFSHDRINARFLELLQRIIEGDNSHE